MSLKEVRIGARTVDLLQGLYSGETVVLNSPLRPPAYAVFFDTPELPLWEELYWILVLQNRIISTPVDKIKIFSEGSLELIIRGIKSTWSFDVMTIGDPTSLECLGFDIDFPTSLVEVRDYFAVKRGAQHEFWKLSTSDNFVKHAMFYLSPRIDGNKDRKDVVAISFLEKDLLQDFDYSDTMVLFKLKMMMNKQLGLKNGVKIKHLRREVLPPKEFKLLGAPKTIRQPAIKNLKELYDRYKSEYRK